MKKKILIPVMITMMALTSACGSSVEAAAPTDNTVSEDEVKVRLIEEEGDEECTPSAGVRIVEEDGVKYLVYKTPQYFHKQKMERIHSMAEKVKEFVEDMTG